MTICGKGTHGQVCLEDVVVPVLLLAVLLAVGLLRAVAGVGGEDLVELENIRKHIRCGKMRYCAGFKINNRRRQYIVQERGKKQSFFCCRPGPRPTTRDPPRNCLLSCRGEKNITLFANSYALLLLLLPCCSKTHKAKKED